MTAQSATGADRSRASAIVEAAHKSGRIIAADRDLRLDRIRSASSAQDLDLVIRDLPGGAGAIAVGASYSSAPTMSTASTTSPADLASMPPPRTSPHATPHATPGATPPWPLVNYGPPTDSGTSQFTATVGSAGRKIGGIIAVIVVVSVIAPVVGTIIALFSASQSFTSEGPFSEPADEQTYSPGVDPGADGVNLFTVTGMDQLVAAIDAEFDSTEIFSAVLYPRYAVVSVPEKPNGTRYRMFRWDGRTLSVTPSKSTSDGPRIDLAALDAAVLLDLMDHNLARMDDENLWYAVIDSLGSDQPRLAVYASNEYGESVYTLADLDGDITYESEE